MNPVRHLQPQVDFSQRICRTNIKLLLLLVLATPWNAIKTNLYANAVQVAATKDKVKDFGVESLVENPRHQLWRCRSLQ